METQKSPTAQLRDDILRALASRRVSRALDLAESLLEAHPTPWQRRRDLERLRQDYQLLRQYALDGADDPHRHAVYDDITGALADLVALTQRDEEAAESPSLYFSTLRYERLQASDTIASLARAVTAAAGAEPPAMAEAAEKRLFNRVWTTFPLSPDDEEALSALLLDEDTAADTRALIVGALLLALTHYYDDRALYLLLQAYYSSADVMVAARALTAALIAISVHRQRRPSKRLSKLLESVRELPGWRGDVQAVALQLLRTRDTERISHTMRDELLPEMLKIRNDLIRKFGDNPSAAADPDALSPEENPEWAELLEKSGIADKMRRLQEMQEEGADVMMGTFSSLKTFPFFNDVANWMLPFRPTHTAVAGAPAPVVELMQANEMMCDSDRYSVLLAMGLMPRERRDLLSRQLDQQLSQAREQAEGDLPTGATQALTVQSRLFVQDLYRFFRLFRRKGDFNDPFATSLNLATVPTLAEAFGTGSADLLGVVAEFCFSHGHYSDAADLFTRIIDHNPGHPEAQLLQKRGYARQQLADTRGALDDYLRADMLQPDHLWTLRRIAACHRSLGDSRQALDVYDRILTLDPDDLASTLQAGHCHLELGAPREALQRYFKVEYLGGDRSLKAIRPIAWCSFLTGDYDRAADYYSRIPEAKLSAHDYLNMGHLSMARRDYHTALLRYRCALSAFGGDRTALSRAFQGDLPHLRAAGVDDLITGLVLDTLLQ